MLNLGYTKLTGGDRPMSRLPSLTSLVLDGCQWLTDAGLDHLLTSWPNLKSLSLMHSHIIGRSICTPCPRLEQLNLCNCRRITDQGLDNLLTLWGSELKELGLEYTLIFGDLKTTSACPRLEKLNLRDCLSLTDSGLNRLLQLCNKSLQGWKHLSCSHGQQLSQ